MTPDQNRLKSAMIVFALEKALGDLVKREFSGDPALTETGAFIKIATRESLSTDLPLSQRLHSSVAASYLEEILNLAAEASAKAGAHDNLKALTELAVQLDLFSIRNAISHPNREFHDCYWYRSAAIASDPLIDKLELHEVRAALEAAEEGKIKAPPDEWMTLVYSSVPNNLPGDFEHELTGLIGRQKERRELLTHLTIGRYQLISVLAPGGLGKTAIALDVLRECVLDPRTRDWCDGIIFLAFKQERLTAEGIENLSAGQTISELSEELVEALQLLFPSVDLACIEDAKLKLAKERILLCVDNLETLLRDDATTFTQFYESLPASWRVLVTSRVTLDGAKSLSLGTLSTEGARALVYRYFNAKGLDVPSVELVAQVVDGSAKNPLALRLIVDRYANGFQLVQAKSTVERDIVAFSYKNLVETLSGDALSILECLFVQDNFTRGELIETLRLDADAAAQAIKDLTSTSLVTRRSVLEEERLSLSPSVRDLLRENPRNLSVREGVRRQIDEQARAIRHHKSIQRQHGFSPYSEDFIGDDMPPDLSAIIVQAIKILRSEQPAHQQVVTVLNRLSQVVALYKTFANAYITLGRLYLLATDSLNAEKCFRRAVELGTEMPTARLVLANYLLVRERPEEAVTLTEELFEQGWHEVKRSDEFTARRVWILYFRALKDTGRFDDLIATASRAEGSEAIKANARAAIAQAIILKVGNFHAKDSQMVIQGLTEAASLLQEKPQHGHVRGFWKSSGRLLCRELHHLFSTAPTGVLSNKDIMTVLELIEPNVDEIYDRVYRNRQLLDILESFQLAIADSANPFLSEKWRQFTGNVETQSDRLSQLFNEGYQILTVFKVPVNDDFPLYVFAENDAGERFYVHSTYCAQNDYRKWDRLRVGSRLAARNYLSPRNERDYPRPTEIVLL